MSLYLVEAAKRKTAQKRQHQTLNREDIESHLKIMDKQDRLIHFKPNFIQRDFAQKRTRRDLFLKSRQVGATTYCRKEDFVISQLQPSRQLVIADKSDNTQKLRRMNDRFYDNLPERLKIGRTSDNAATTVYDNGSEVSIDTAGSSSAGRASTFTRLHASEVAYWKDATDIMTGILNTLPIDGYAVAESTPNGATGWFFNECMKALSGDSVWTLHFYEWWHSEYNQLSRQQLTEFGKDTLLYPYTEEETELIALHGLTEHQILWRRYKIAEDPQKFKQEHPEDVVACFLTSGNSYFGDIEHVFTAPQNPTYDSDHTYIGGLDFAQDNDYTVLKVIDQQTYEQVDTLRINNLRWRDMRTRIIQVCDQWQVNLVIAEWNSIGKVNIEAMREESDLDVKAFKTTAKSKPMLIQSLYAGLHEHGLRLQDAPNTKHEFRNFISKQTPSGNWQYEAADGAHDDEVIATALAWYGVMRGNYTIEAI